jgi:hypothetical protein
VRSNDPGALIGTFAYTSMDSHCQDPQWTKPSGSSEDRVTGIAPMAGLLIEKWAGGSILTTTYYSDAIKCGRSNEVENEPLLPCHACTTLRSGYNYVNTMELLHDAAWATQILAEMCTSKQHE